MELGCCHTCWTKLKPVVGIALADVHAELPEELTGVPPRHKCFRRQKCTRCGWEGHEGQMRKLPTLTGDGAYYGGCPNCPAQNGLFCMVIQTQPGFVVVDVPPAPEPPAKPPRRPLNVPPGC